MLLLSQTLLAQDGEQYLKTCAYTLALNRSISPMHSFASKRAQARQDTVAATGMNYRFRALRYVWQRDYEQAAAWFEKTTTLFPNEHGAAGEFYMSFLCDYPRALRHLDAHDALTPNFDDLINHNPVSYLRGLVYRNMGGHDKAIAQFSAGIDPLEHKHGAEWVNYRHYVSRAISYIATGQAAKALIDLDKATKNFGRSALVQYYRGRAFQQLNRLTEARTAFQDASFFLKAMSVERTGFTQEDDFNPLYESQIEAAIEAVKPKP